MADPSPPVLDPFQSAVPRSNAVHAQLGLLVDAYSSEASEKAEWEKGPGACLPQILWALNWRGDKSRLIESMPHMQTIDDVETLRAVLVRLKFLTVPMAVAPDALLALELPCLFSQDGKRILVLTARTGEGVEVFDSQTGRTRVITCLPEAGTAYLPRPIDSTAEQSDLARRSWAGVLVKRFRITIAQLLLVSLLINALALLPSLFILAVYDTAIATKSPSMLFSLLAGICIALAVEYGFRQIRGRAFSYLGARWEVITGAKALERVLYLPIALTERGPVTAQITRLRQFENLRDLFSGQMAVALLDLPFVFISFVAIAAIGGRLVWAPLALVACLSLLASVSLPAMRRRFAMVGESRQRMFRLLLETVTKHRTINESGATGVWQSRVDVVAFESARRHASAEQLNLYITNTAQALASLTGLATLFFGLELVMVGNLSVGGLIATMAIVWRFMNPVQSAFLNLNRLQQVFAAFRQANQLFRIPPEREPGVLPAVFHTPCGDIALSRLSFRYSPTSDPALNSVSLRVPAGQLVAVTGASGGGKSTLLRLLAKLYSPQGGAILIDGVDIRQIDAGELRRNVSHVPDYFDFFHGTIAQNLRLAAPLATDEEVHEACVQARIHDYDSVLPQGVNTWMKADLAARLPPGLKQRILLARAWVKKAPIYLLDEPANNLDRVGEEALIRKLETLRGRATVIMVTHRPSHMSAADRLVYLQDGLVQYDGKPGEILPLILSAA